MCCTSKLRVQYIASRHTSTTRTQYIQLVLTPTHIVRMTPLTLISTSNLLVRVRVLYSLFDTCHFVSRNVYFAILLEALQSTPIALLLTSLLYAPSASVSLSQQTIGKSMSI